MNTFETWSKAELALRQARIAYKAATKALINNITEVNGPWPCDEDDPEFVTVDTEDGPVLLELKPFDEPLASNMPFDVHHLEKIKL